MKRMKVFSGWPLLCLAFIGGFGFTALAQEATSLVGSGSNVPTPLYTVWVEEFNKRDPQIQIHYLSTGTSQSIKDISRGVGDFGAGEMPWTDEELHAAKTEILHIPTVVVGIVPIYHLPGVRDGLRFSGDALAKIFLGTIRKWNDPHLAKLNPNISLPDLEITVVHRTDGKASNYILTEFLSKVSPEFKAQVGRSPSPHWPLGQSANRGEDMVEKVRNVSGAIGYVERGFVAKGGVSAGAVQNAAGQFIEASPETIAAACLAFEKSMPADLRVSMTNAPGKDAFPMTSFTWLYVPVRSATPERSRAMKDFLNWALTEGQRTAQEHGYEPLPSFVLQKALAKVRSLGYDTERAGNKR